MSYDYIKFGYDSISNTALGPTNTSGAGLQDRFGVIKKIILYGYLLNMTPVIPSVVLNGKHQIHKKNKISNLSEYYDYSRLKINGNKFNVVTDIGEIDETRVLNINYFNGHTVLGFDHTIQGSSRKTQRGILDEFPKLNFFLPFNKSVIYNSEKIISKYFSGSYSSLHIRRGDKLNVAGDEHRNHLSKVMYDEMTRVENVKKTLRKKSITGDVFVMTDMTDADEALSDYRNKSDEFNFIFTNDITELKNIKINDNYLLWVTERQVARSGLCNNRITMDHIKDEYTNRYGDV